MSYLYSHNKKEIFNWDEKHGICTCTITTNFGKFYGIACCHPDDTDMKSQCTGEQIAYNKALIEMLKYERDCILKPQIIALGHTLSLIAKKDKNELNSYAAKTLKRQTRNLKCELFIVRESIEDQRKKLHNYITEKEKMYQRIRAKAYKTESIKNTI